jgi:hypothetical protein
LSAPERRTIVAALIEIAAAKLTLPEVWTLFRRQKEAIAKQATLTPKGFEDVVAEFRKRKLAAGKSAKYVKDTGDFFMKFGAGRDEQSIHEISAEDLEKLIDDQAKEKQ